jgi:DNA-binding HxlR family transcriptional regulator
MARIRHERIGCSPGCAVEAASSLIYGKWNGVALDHLLEADGLILRTVYAELPPKVQYSPTARGRSLEPMIAALKAWADARVDLAALADAGARRAPTAETKSAAA